MEKERIKNEKGDEKTSNNEVTPFVKDWDVVQVLGEGAFGEVKLLVNRNTHDAIAVKVVDLSLPECERTILKEAKVLKMLKHENVIGYLGERKESDCHYLFLEYAAGGELFDRIEPDIGMPEQQAQNYFRQLIRGTEYLHSKGVAHRDLKPENLLLTDSDVLKISDFGMATIFRHRGEERLLNKRCGTLPYVAPEVILREYRAEPADIWSVGVVLVALLAGELPWDSPSSSCRQFCNWRDGEGWRQKPFSKIDNVALSLLRAVLNCIPEQRATIERIKLHQWVVKDFNRKRLVSKSPCPQIQAKRLRSNLRLQNPKSDLEDENARICFSQFENSTSFDETSSRGLSTYSTATVDGIDARNSNSVAEWPATEAKDTTFSFSQPAKLDSLLINTQSQLSQAALNPLQKLVKRMTRFFVTVSMKTVFGKIEDLSKSFNYATKRTTPTQLTIFTLDTRRNHLSFKVNAYETHNNRVLIDFRLSKGDGLDFKRIFVKFRDRMKLIIDHAEIDSWSFAELNYAKQTTTSNENSSTTTTTKCVVAAALKTQKLADNNLITNFFTVVNKKTSG